MNTCFLFISNIPKMLRSSTINKEMGNKWSDIVLIDNPGSELNDAFIYNPTSNSGYFDKCVENLRKFEIDGGQPLKVYYVWFPGPTSTLVTMIPDCSILLPYIIVDFIPKEFDITKIYSELPFAANDVKQWNIPYKEDKWVVLKLPANYDDVTRNFILSYTRTFSLPSGGFPRATEVIVTEEPRLTKTVIPVCVRSWTTTKSYKSNLLFLYDLPTKYSAPNIQEGLNYHDIKHVKTFFIETVNEMRAGFAILPKFLSDSEYENYVDKLGQDFTIPSIDKTIRLHFCEVWTQPKNCLPPKNNKSGFKFLLSPYLYLRGIHESINSSDISARSPHSIRICLFSSSNSNSKSGIVCLRGISTPNRVVRVIDYLRSLVFRNRSIQVDELWMKMRDDNKEISDYMMDSRDTCIKSIETNNNRAVAILEEIMKNEEVHITKLIMPDKPPFSYRLQMTRFLFIMNLDSKPKDYNNLEDVLIDLKIHFDGATSMDIGDGEKIGIVKIATCSDKIWLNYIERLAKQGYVIRVIYIQHDEDIDLIQSKLSNIHLSQYVLVRDIDFYDQSKSSSKSSKKSAFKFIHELCPHIESICSVKCAQSNNKDQQNVSTSQSSESYGFLRIGGGCQPMELLDLLKQIRSLQRIGNGFLGAFTVWLGEVGLLDDNMDTCN